MWNGGGADITDKELQQLKQRLRESSESAANSATAIIQLSQQLKDLNQSFKEQNHLLAKETDRATKTETLLLRRDAELKTLEYQHINATNELRTSQVQFKQSQQENKRLQYEIEYSSTSSSSSSNVGSKWVQEKAKLEATLAELTTNLLIAQSALDGERLKGNVGDKSDLMTEKARGTDLEDQVTSLQADSERLQSDRPRPVSRSSISPADAQPTRNRFGFGLNASSSGDSKPRKSLLPEPSATPARPASSLGSYLPVPAVTNRRRSSSISAFPPPSIINKSTIDATKTLQLERTRSAALEVESTAIKSKLAVKEREVLKMENEFMAFEQEKSALIEGFKTKLSYAREETVELKREVVRAREEARAESDKKLQEAFNQKSDLTKDIERMRVSLEKKEKDLERSESTRERLADQLRQIESDSKEAHAKYLKSIASIAAEKMEIEREVILLRDEIKREVAKAAQRDALEIALVEAKRATEDIRSNTVEQVRSLVEEKDELARSLAVANDKLAAALVQQTNREHDAEAEVSQLTSNLAALTSQHGQLEEKLAESLATIAQMGSVDVVEPTEILDEMLALKNQVLDLQNQLVESSKAMEDLQTAMEATIKISAESIAEADELRAIVECGKEELAKLSLDCSVLESKSNQDTAQKVILNESIVVLQSELAAKEARSIEIAAQLAIAVSSNATDSSSSDRLVLDLAAATADIDQLTLSKLDLESKLAASIEQHVIMQGLLSSSIETNAASLAESLAAATSNANFELEGLRAINQQSLEATDQLQITLSSISIALATSELKVAELESRPLRSFDDAEVEIIRLESVCSMKSVEDLKQKMVDLASLEWGAKEAKKDAEERIAALEVTKEGLENQIQELTSSGIRSERELETLREGLSRYELRETELVERLDSETMSLQQFDIINLELATKSTDLDLALRRVELVEEKLQATNVLLDSTLLASDEAAFIALQEARSLEDRIIELEDVVRQLREDLGSAACDSVKIEDLAKEAARFEEVIVGLRLELELANSRSTMLDALVSSLQHDLQHSSQQIDLSSFASDAQMLQSITLVQRLREERDNLRGQLDFSCNESRFGSAALADQLRITSDLAESDRLASVAALFEEAESRRSLEESARVELKDFEERLRTVEQDLQESRADAVDANAKLMEFAHDAEALALEFDQLQIKSNLSEAAVLQSDAELVKMRSDLEEAQSISSTAAAEVLRVEQLIADLSTTLARQLDSIQGLSTLLSTSTQKVVDLEHDLVSAKAVVSSLPISDVLDTDLVESIDAERERMQLVIDELEAKVNRRTIQIGVHEQTIAVMRSREVIEQNAEASDDTMILGESATTTTMELEAAIAELEVGHHDELERRLQVELELGAATTRLVVLEAELDSARNELQQHIAGQDTDSTASQLHIARLSTDLVAAQREVGNLSSSLVESQAALASSIAQSADLETAHDELLATFASTSQLYASTLTQIAELELEQSKVEIELDEARKERGVLVEHGVRSSEAVAEMTLLHTEMTANLQQSEQLVVDLNEKLSISSSATQQAQQELLASNIALSASQSQLESQQAVNVRLEAEVTRLEGVVGSLEAELAESAIDRELILALESQLSTSRVEDQAAIAGLERRQEELQQINAEAAKRFEEEKMTAISEIDGELRTIRTELSSTLGLLQSTEAQLLQSQQQHQQLEEAVRSEKANAAKALVEVEARASREIQTLRKLARDATATNDAILLENVALEADVDNAMKKADQLAHDASRQSQALEELSRHLSVVESEREAALAHILQLEQDIASLEGRYDEISSALASNSGGSLAEVKDLEKRLKRKEDEMEDTDEKYLEVLRMQKKYLSQIERLKVKVEGLQRSRITAEATTAPAPLASSTPSSAAATTAEATVPASAAPSSGKKRRSPAEFDPTPSSTPRAIIATTVKKVVATSKENQFDSSYAHLHREDGLVALKPAAASPVKRETREPLSVLRSNPSLAPTVAASTSTSAMLKGSSALKARLDALKAARSASIANV